MQECKVSVHRLAHALDLPLPGYMTAEAAGMDLLAAIGDPLVLLPGRRALVPTGLQLALPAGVEAQVRPRSGLAINHGICVLNSPGTIDADYRGEIKIILANLGEDSFVVQRGDRIAQLVFGRVIRASFCEVEVLPGTERGEGGFGHTGV